MRVPHQERLQWVLVRQLIKYACVQTDVLMYPPSNAPNNAPIGKEVITIDSVDGDKWNCWVSWSVIVPKIVISYASKNIVPNIKNKTILDVDVCASLSMSLNKSVLI